MSRIVFDGPDFEGNRPIDGRARCPAFLTGNSVIFGVIRRILPCVHHSLRQSLSEVEAQIRLLNARRAVLSGLLSGDAGEVPRG